jgi:hypothetical protein
MKTGIFISIIKDFTNFNFYTSFVICLILNHTTYSQSGLIDFPNIEFGKTVEPSYKSMSDSSISLSVVESNYLLSVDEMIDNIKDKKIVIINEHHEIPQNRIFWRLLARKLYAYGYNKIFIEGVDNPISIFTESELNFLKSKELIDIKDNLFKPLFVGEIITTENKYFSLPKNFKENNENVELLKKVLIRYKDLKKDSKTLLSNNTFTVSNSSDIKSEKFYFNELKEFFLDYITYEYIHPKNDIKKHSSSPMSGKIDVFNTIRNRKQKGPGITYKIKDIKNNKDCNIDDIYWTTIKTLCDKYGNSDDILQINEMREFLENEGYDLNNIDISDTDKTISNIQKCDVGIIHQPIKNTLLDYYKNIPVGEKFKINIFYTIKFQYVWEELVRESLKENKKFRKSLENLFFRKENRTKWFPTQKSADEFIKTNNVK